MKNLSNFSFNKDIILLSTAFGLIFFAYSSVQQFVTIYFKSLGMEKSGFISLIIIYIFLSLFTAFSGIIVYRLGPRKSMMISSFFYAAYILSLISGNIYLIYFCSALLGIAATLLWVGQNSSLVMFSQASEYGKNSGLFNLFNTIFVSLGIIFLSYAVSFFSFNYSFAVLSIFPLLGIIMLYKIKEITPARPKLSIKASWRALTSLTTFKICLNAFLFSYISGITIGALPLAFADKIGAHSTGLIMSLFYVMPLIMTLMLGKSSDKLGRKFYIILSYLLCLAAFTILLFSPGLIGLTLVIIILSLNYSIMRPITMALVGDVSESKNIELITSVMLLMQGLGVFSALLITIFLPGPYLYPASLVITIIIFLLVYSAIRQPLDNIRQKIEHEIG